MALDVDLLSRSRDGERRVTATARGLFLTRDLIAQRDTEHGWSHDTAIGGLGLDAGDLMRLEGKRVLDVASGLSIVGTELSFLRAHVDCVDIEIDDAHPSFDRVRDLVREQYPRELERVKGELDADERDLLQRLKVCANAVTDAYPAVSGQRIVVDACTLAGVEAEAYDLVLCGWLMVHLEPEDEDRAIASMQRVVKQGGAIHIRRGYGNADLLVL